jgi:hypothetical protein
MPKLQTAVLREIRAAGQWIFAARRGTTLELKPKLVEVKDSELRREFDRALDLLHYAKSCQMELRVAEHP